MDLFESFLELTDQVTPAPEPEPERYLGLSPTDWLDRVELVERTELQVEGIPQTIALTPRIEALHEGQRFQLRSTDSGVLLINGKGQTRSMLRMNQREWIRFRELVDQAQARGNGRLL